MKFFTINCESAVFDREILPRETIWPTPSRMRIPHVFCILAIDLQDKYTQNSWKNLENKNGFLAKDAGHCSDWFGAILGYRLL